MRTYLTEKNIVIALFIIVLITFSLAQEDSRKFDNNNPGVTAGQHIKAKKTAEKNTSLATSNTLE